MNIKNKGFDLAGILIIITVIGGVVFYYQERTLEGINDDNISNTINKAGETKDLVEENNEIFSENLDEINTKEIYFAGISNVIFEVCDTLENHKESSWYENFKSQIEKLDRYSEADAERLYEMNKNHVSSPQEMIDVAGKHRVEDVRQVCYSKEGYLLAITQGEYGGSGFKFIRYNIESDIIDFAKREDLDGGKDTAWYKSHIGHGYDEKDVYKWFSPPYKFSTIEENNIELVGGSVDAGCSSESWFNYSLEKNYITIKRTCSSCQEETPTCTEYYVEL
ncbi:hypothetical protein KKC45_02080 [Patescibacteria group bacterium]|nr:hypothetical protein [Patescibacteria group bacterium]